MTGTCDGPEGACMLSWRHTGNHATHWPAPPHGQHCACRPCLTIRFNLHQGRPHIALNVAVDAGTVTDRHLELAWLTGIDALRCAGYGRPLAASEQAQLVIAGDNTDEPDHELRAAMAEVRRLRGGIRHALHWANPDRHTLLALLEPADLT